MQDLRIELGLARAVAADGIEVLARLDHGGGEDRRVALVGRDRRDDAGAAHGLGGASGHDYLQPVSRHVGLELGRRRRVDVVDPEARLDRLLTLGAVLGFTIRMRDASDDRAVRAIMTIEVEGKSTTAIIKRLRGFSELHALHTTNGRWDLIAEIRAGSLADFDRVLREVRAIEGIRNSETSLMLSSIE